MTNQSTSWSGAAEWYGNYLETTPDSYQRQVILPNLLRLLAIKPGMKILDLACGQGFFSRELAKAGALVAGADLSPDLIAQAKKLSPPTVNYYVRPAHKLDFAPNQTYEAAIIILAVQNIENIAEVLAEAARVLKPEGRLILVMMHPAFRIPGASAWGWDEAGKIQYRRADAYLSARRSELLVHPGQADSPITVSYHRSLQDLAKPLFKAGLTITRLEEWISPRQSEPGPRQAAENLARKEFPLFLMLEARPDR
jgi:SAM-dependent methyltransferase